LVDRRFSGYRLPRGKIQAQILQGVGALIDKNIYSELVNAWHLLNQNEGVADLGGCQICDSVHLDVGFGVNRIRETWSRRS